jgi:fumarate hydratase class II
MNQHLENDSLGPVTVPDDVLWGPQTQRSLQNFPIGTTRMPMEVIYALTIIKQAVAVANQQLDVISASKAEAIISACQQIRTGKYDDQFPLKVYQTGSGTQTNMNVNEVIAHLAALAGCPLHPNDDVNKSQSSNDVFPTAMQIATVNALTKRLLPTLSKIETTLQTLADENKDQLKVGRTHLQDAVTMTFGQEIGGWKDAIGIDHQALLAQLPLLMPLPLGGTAIGTGLNAPASLADYAIPVINQLTNQKFISLPDKFTGLAFKNTFATLSGILATLASDLIKIANDIRWLTSGPQAGLNEITIPANEPGSSIMPGKINPTQAEALIMVCLQVMGYSQTITMANSQGNFQLNVTMPLIITDTLDSINLLSDAIDSFTTRLLNGLSANTSQMDDYVAHNIMNATLLNPYIGYDATALVVKKARKENLTVRQAVISLKLMSPEDFDRYYNPATLANPTAGKKEH